MNVNISNFFFVQFTQAGQTSFELEMGISWVLFQNYGTKTFRNVVDVILEGKFRFIFDSETV